MAKLKDITGRRFGRLIVINREPDRINQNGKPYTVWKCICDCGNFKLILSTSLIGGGTKSCGCLLSESSSTRRKLPKGIAYRNRVIGTIKRSAIKRNLDFKISDDEIKKLLEGNCHYCDSLPSDRYDPTMVNGTVLWNGIDRIDNSLGYISDNCVSCCAACNRAKFKTSYQDFINYLDRLIEFRTNCADCGIQMKSVLTEGIGI